LTERLEEQLISRKIKHALEIGKTTMRFFLKHKAMLDTNRKVLKNRQRRIVEKAYRTGLLACQS